MAGKPDSETEAKQAGQDGEITAEELENVAGGTGPTIDGFKPKKNELEIVDYGVDSSLEKPDHSKHSNPKWGDIVLKR